MLSPRGAGGGECMGQETKHLRDPAEFEEAGT